MEVCRRYPVPVPHLLEKLVRARGLCFVPQKKSHKRKNPDRRSQDGKVGGTNSTPLMLQELLLCLRRYIARLQNGRGTSHGVWDRSKNGSILSHNHRKMRKREKKGEHLSSRQWRGTIQH